MTNHVTHNYHRRSNNIPLKITIALHVLLLLTTLQPKHTFDNNNNNYLSPLLMVDAFPITTMRQNISSKLKHLTNSIQKQERQRNLMTQRRTTTTTTTTTSATSRIMTLLSQSTDNNNEESKMEDINIMMDVNNDELSDDILDEIEEGAPPVLMVMKQLLGINIFTYILAGAIAIMLSLNGILGPGWLGQKLGLEGTGTFTEVSESLPQPMDLNSPENLL